MFGVFARIATIQRPEISLILPQALPVTLRQLLRAVPRLFGLALLLLASVFLVALIFPLLGQTARSRIKQSWSAMLVAVLGITLRHDNLDDDDLPVGLVVANHISFLDIYVINALMSVNFVAKADVAGWPLIGWLTARTGNLFIERGRAKAAHAMQQQMARELSAGNRLVIFPEGTSTRGGAVLPFHAALLQSAIASGCPVICLALSYQSAKGEMTTAPAYVGDDTLMGCIWRIVIEADLVANVHLVGCLSSEVADRRHLGQQAHHLIAQGVERACQGLTPLLD